MKLGFIGAGEMGGAILRGLLARGVAKEELMVSVRTENSAKKIAAELGIPVGINNREVLVGADWLFIAVKPAQTEEVLREIAASGVPAKPLICMALGWSVEKIQRILPSWPVIRIMPNTPLAVGEGATLFHFAAETPKRARREVMGLFDSLGKTFEVSLSVFEAATALSGSGPAFVYTFLGGLVQAAQQQGLPVEQAKSLAIQTLVGAAKMVEKTGEDPLALARKVATPGGCTAAGMEVLSSSDFLEILSRTLQVTTKRAKEYTE